MKYPTIIFKERDMYGVVFPDFQGCVTVGDTLSEAIFNASEALQLHVDGMQEDGDTIPQPSGITGLAESFEDYGVLFTIYTKVKIN